MYQSYDLSHYLEGDLSQSTSFTVSDDDAINCAHMLAAGFNTISRKMMGDFVLAVVDTKAGTVQYDGKVEMINRLEPTGPFTGGSFNFEATVPLDPSAVRLFFGDEAYSFTTVGKVTTDEPSKYAHIAREVLEEAYEEIGNVKAALETVGVETIPPSAGVRDLIRRNDFEYSARTAYEQRHNEENEAARAEMISFVKRAHAKKVKLQTAVPDGDGRPELDDRWRGMLDVLAKFLVITGEADKDEGHAVARRLCEIDEEMS
jgi:hypothetical protein